MKSVILNVRISQDLRNKLENLSLENKTSISDTIRNILKNHFENPGNEHSDYVDVDYLYHSNQFLFLITWMFEKTTYCYDDKSEMELLGLKNIVIDVINEKSFPSDLRAEFEKVLVDLIRYSRDFHSLNNYFKFCKPHHSGSFDYSLLLKYIADRAFENVIYV